jgi:hypothetical protein
MIVIQDVLTILSQIGPVKGPFDETDPAGAGSMLRVDCVASRIAARYSLHFRNVLPPATARSAHSSDAYIATAFETVERWELMGTWGLLPLFGSRSLRFGGKQPLAQAAPDRYCQASRSPLLLDTVTRARGCGQ